MSIQQTASDSILTQAELQAKTLALLIGKHSDGREKKIGLEVEMPYFQTTTLKPIPFSGPKSIRALFNGLSKRPTGWQPCEVENGNVTSLSSTIGMITLEPGGQVEFASAPKESIAALGKDIATYLSDSREVSAKLGIDVLPFGFHPHTRIEDCPYIDQRSRFKSLRPVFEAEGGFAAWGQSSSVQITLDSPSRDQAFAAFKLGMVLQPLAAAMCAHSPYQNEEVSGYQSTRRHKLLELDSPLYAIPDGFYDDDFGMTEWAQHVLNVPMSFIVRAGQYISVAPKPFREMVGIPLPELAHLPESQRYLTDSDLLDHLTGVKPEMLLKPNLLLEFRAADLCPQPQHWLGLCAFWTGIFYDPQAFQDAQDYISSWTKDTRKNLKDSVAQHGLATLVGTGTARTALMDLLQIASDGLSRYEPGAQSHLDTMIDIVEKGRTPADVALERLASNGGDMRKTLNQSFLFKPARA